MMDFLERLFDLLDSQDYYSSIHVPILVDGNSIAVMTMPSNNKQYYFDGSYRQGYAFQVMTKHEQQLAAYHTLLSITSLLEQVPDIPSGNGSYQYEGMTVTTSPNVVSKDDKHYIYAAQFSAALYITRE